MTAQTLDIHTFIQYEPSLCRVYGQFYLAAAYFKVEAFSLSFYTSAAIPLPSSIHHSVDKRQAEFLAGRYLAKQLLPMLGAPRTEVAIAENRAPVWPDGIVGSLSHHDRFAICAVGRHNTIDGIGIDVEAWLTAETAQQVHSHITTLEEVEVIKQSGGFQCSWHQLITILFSAKESLFKAISPQVQGYFDFHSMRLIEVDWQNLQLTFELLETLSLKHQQGQHYFCSMMIQEEQVITCVLISEEHHFIGFAAQKSSILYLDAA